MSARTIGISVDDGPFDETVLLVVVVFGLLDSESSPQQRPAERTLPMRRQAIACFFILISL
jgi:hypothetical protein